MINNHLQLKKDRPYAVKSTQDFVTIKDVDLSKKIVTGFYNTALYFDNDYDVVLKGAADKSINDRGPVSASVQKIKHLMFHDWTQLPGKILVLEERTEQINGKTITGIYFETKMSDTQLGTDALINYQEGIYDNHSIGFQYLDGEWVDEEADDWDKYIQMLINPEAAQKAGFMYVWKEIKLWEGSTVAFGSNALTPYLGVKNLDNRDALCLKVSDRISLLGRQVSGGKQSDEALQSMEMQLMQLKQIVTELFSQEPDIKSTLQQQGRKEKSTSDEGAFNIKQLLQTF